MKVIVFLEAGPSGSIFNFLPPCLSSAVFSGAVDQLQTDSERLADGVCRGVSGNVAPRSEKSGTDAAPPKTMFYRATLIAVSLDCLFHVVEFPKFFPEQTQAFLYEPVIQMSQYDIVTMTHQIVIEGYRTNFLRVRMLQTFEHLGPGLIAERRQVEQLANPAKCRPVWSSGYAGD